MMCGGGQGNNTLQQPSFGASNIPQNSNIQNQPTMSGGLGSFPQSQVQFPQSQVQSQFNQLGLGTQPQAPQTFAPQVSSAGTFTPPQTQQPTTGFSGAIGNTAPTQPNQFGFQGGLPQPNNFGFQGNMDMIRKLLGMG